MNNNIEVMRTNFFEAGYDCIPLIPLSKLPIAKSWPMEPIINQWDEVAKINGDLNLGLRAGNGKAFIDCDDKEIPGTSENVFNWMAGLGYDRGSYPIVQTASGIGHHIYVNFTGSLQKSRRNLTRSLGAGDFRYSSGSYVATFPSVVAINDGHNFYKLIEGDINHLPTLDQKDISTLINITETTEEPNDVIELKYYPENVAFERKKRKSMSPLAKAICRGEKLDKHKSNSEAESALVLSLINSGFDYGEIRQVFNTNPCMGHYANKHANRSIKEGERWLRKTYDNALEFSKNNESPTRRKIKEWRLRVDATPWKNITNKNLFDTVLEIAYITGRHRFDLSVRDASLGACVGIRAASNGLKRISSETGMIELVRKASGKFAATYELREDKVEHTLRALNERVCSTLSTSSSDGINPPKNSRHDAFRNGGGRYAKGRLGQRAGEIYELLFKEPLTIAEISFRLGASEKTVKRKLKKMHALIDRKTGEIIEMVTCENDKWRSNRVDLNLVALIIGTYGANEKKEVQYIRDRIDREHAWEESKKKTIG